MGGKNGREEWEGRMGVKNGRVRGGEGGGGDGEQREIEEEGWRRRKRRRKDREENCQGRNIETVDSDFWWSLTKSNS